MKRITKVGLAGIASAGLLVGAASAAFAAPPPGGSPAGPSIGLTITNPASATVTASETSITLNALTNDTQATSFPSQAQTFSEIGPGGSLGGALYVDVVSNNGDGYTLYATSSDLAGSGSLAAQPAYDLNIEATDFTGTGDNPAFLTGHLGAAADTLNDPAYQQILSNTGTSASNPQLTDWNIGHGNTTPTTPAGTDEVGLSYWVQPDTLLGTSSGYTATESFYYVPNP